MGGEVLRKLGLAQQVSDMLSRIQAGIDAQVSFSHRIAPLYTVYLIKNDDSFGHCRGGAAQTFECRGDLLMRLLLLARQAGQPCKHVSPSPRTVGQRFPVSGQPLVQRSEVA